MFEHLAGLTDEEILFRDKHWTTADHANAGLEIIMEREGARIFMTNPNGPGTFIRQKDGSVRFIGPEEYRGYSIYGRRLEEVWITFRVEFERRAKEQHREKTKRLKSDAHHLRLTGCYHVRLPADFKAEEKREATLIVEFRLSEGVIACSCDPEQVWEGKTLRISTETGEPPILDGERTIEVASAAQELLNEFTDRLDPCQPQ